MQQPNTYTESHDEQQRQEQIRRNQAATGLLNVWEQEDAEEQHETWKFLKRALEEDSLAFRRVGL